eukprot:2374121-Rhodomonas_salina.2
MCIRDRCKGKNTQYKAENTQYKSGRAQYKSGRAQYKSGRAQYKGGRGGEPSPWKPGRDPPPSRPAPRSHRA